MLKESSFVDGNKPSDWAKGKGKNKQEDGQNEQELSFLNVHVAIQYWAEIHTLGLPLSGTHWAYLSEVVGRFSIIW